jgi:hypothetical protein
MVSPSACCWGARRAGSRCSLGESVGGKLRLLSGLLVTEGRTVSVGIDRGASEGSTSGEVHRLVLPDNACSVGISKSEKRVEADEIRTALGSSSRSCRVACDGWVPKRRSRLSGLGRRPATSGGPKLAPVAENPGALRLSSPSATSTRLRSGCSSRTSGIKSSGSLTRICRSR